MHSSFTTFLCFLSLLTLWATHTSAKISLGSSLTAEDGSKLPWLSDSGDFAFGFQRAPGMTGGFLMAIWYNKIPEKTITWSANGNNLAQIGSKLSLTANGLFLSDSNGINMWNATGNGVTYASILDAGNFVVLNKDDKILWQSFDYPTDTILPTQILERGTQLIARFSNANYSSGRFKFVMQTDGNFVGYTLNWPQISVNYAPYYGTPWSWNIGIQLLFKKPGHVSIVGEKGNVLGNVLFSQLYLTQYQYQRAILEYDGVFRLYVYPILSSAYQPMYWYLLDFVPENICNQTGDMGGGPCGHNSYCQIGDDERRPKCSCIPGFSLLDENDSIGGCEMDYIAQDCSSSQQDSDQFELQVMDSTIFEGQDSASVLGISESDCRKSCLFDCECAAAIFDGQLCWKKSFPLSSGWTGPGVDQTTFVKVRVNNSVISVGNKIKWSPVTMCWT